MSVGKRALLGILIIMAAVALCLSAVGFSARSDKTAGAADVALIGTAEQLVDLSRSVSDGNNRLGETFELTADIDLTGTDFYPIGLTNAFHGAFDGKGHTVTVELVGYDYCAFIARLGSSGTLKNLVVRGTVSGSFRTAGIVAENDGEIYNCVNYASVTNNGSMQSYTGGVAAVNTKSITQCVNAGEINASFNAGGIVGNSTGTISVNASFGNVTTSGSSVINVGGVAGIISGTSLDCYAYSSVTTVANASRNNVGSFAGSTTAASGEHNYAIGTAYDFPASGSTGEVAGRFEKKTLYDFLCEDGVVFSSDDFVRADYKQGTGYLYAPAFLTEEGVGGKIVFASEESEGLFAAPLFAAGQGTESLPYEISGKEEWNLFAVNSRLFSYDGVYLALKNDVNVGTDHSASSDSAPFGGIFDGKNKTVTLDNTDGRNNVGLFSFLGNGTVKNLTVKGSLMGGVNVAAVAASVVGNATVSDISNFCDVAANGNIGGIVGFVGSGASLTVNNCVNNGKITCTGARGTGYAGGVVGAANGETVLSKAVNYGVVSAENSGTTAVGGIVGGITLVGDTKANIENAHNEGAVSAAKTDCVGGIIGAAQTENGEISLREISSVADIRGKSNVSGIAGSVRGRLTVGIFAVIGALSGENYVSGAANVISGEIALASGYASVTVTEITGSGAAVFYGDAVAVSVDGNATATEVYYNGDSAKSEAIGAQKKNSVELSGGDLFEGEAMKETEREITGGKYAFPSGNETALKKTDALRVSYFDGTDGQVYLIGSARAMKNFAFLCAEIAGYADYSYRMVNDVTLTEELAQIPVFGGSFDGSAFTVNNLKIYAEGTYGGLFGTLSGEVKNLRLSDGDIITDGGAEYAGAICGKAEETATVYGCYATSTIQGNARYVGGLVGRNEGKIETSFFAGKISGAQNAGGIAGSNGGSIENCFFSGRAAATGAAGGISAESTDGTVINCYVSGRIEGATAGGFIAEVIRTGVSKAYVNADIEATGNKGAFFVSIDEESKGALSECYYNSDYVSAKAYPAAGDAVNNAEYARTTTFFRTPGAGYFSVTGYKRMNSTFNSECDSYFAPYLEAFETRITEQSAEYDEKTAYYVAKSAEISIFGTDAASDFDKGSANNPYLVETAAQFAMIAELTKRTNFSGKYFFIKNDINMNDTSAGNYAIGYFSTTSGNAFCGTVYGSEEHRPTISNVRVDRAQNTDGATSYSYLGVFANTEEGFVLKNIIFNGFVTGTSSIGGLVGYTHKGVIENCLSYINVTADSVGAGGIVGAASGTVTVTGTVCAGKITASADGYGLIGMSGNNMSGLTVSSVGSWVVIGREDVNAYSHNGVGSVLYDYGDEEKGENLTVVDGGERGFGFLLEATDGNYTGKILDGGDNVIATANTVPYYDTVTENISRQYYARYCIGVDGTVVWSDGTDTAFASVSASGEHYIGQEIVISLVWAEAGKARGVKFLGVKDGLGNAVEYKLEPSAGDILVKFELTEDSLVFSIEIGEISDGDILSFSKGDGEEYDGGTRNPTVNVDGCAAEYYLVTGESKTEIKDAGTYRISVRVSDENNNYVGIYETTYVVAKKTLTLGDAEAFGAFYGTIYDKDTAVRTYRFGVSSDDYRGCVIGAADGENPVVVLELTYGSKNAGTNINLEITSCESLDANYRFETTEKDLGAVGVIGKKEITVGLTYDGEKDGKKTVTREYSAGEPALGDAAYEIGVKWKIKDINGVEITVFNAGEYVLTAEPASSYDGDNYKIATDYEYVLVISPYTVAEENFTFGNTTFEYSGGDLSQVISRTVYFTVPFDDGNHAVSLVFYKEREGINETEVINAGTYYAKAMPTDGNYAASENVSLTVINVSRKTADGLNVTLKREDGTELTGGDTVTVEDRILIDLTQDETALKDDYDGVYRVETSYFTTEYDEENGNWYLVPIAGSDGASFRIEGISATNYNNRLSEEFNLRVEKKAVYGILENNVFYFGDEIEKAIKLRYYYKEGERVLGEELINISGLEEPGITLGSDALDAGTYNVMFSGGSSNGYSFEFFTSKDFGARTLTVLPKEITVIVNDAGSKVYGEGKESEIIPYIIVAVGADGLPRELETLPDGRTVELRGSIGRASGENVGEYPLTQGTLTGAETGLTSSNPNYRITVQFNSLFAITKREITVAIARNQGKEYGDADGKILLEPEEGFELVNNPELGIADTIAIFDGAFTVYRDPGEDVGYYGYSITTDAAALSELNYAVTLAERPGNSFVITKTVPHVDFEIMGTVKYGDPTSGISFRGSAENKRGEKIEGTFAFHVFDVNAEGMRRTYFDMGDTTLIAIFTPVDGNFDVVSKSVAITVAKRPVTVTVYKGAGEERIPANGAEFTYSGSAVTSGEFSYAVNGTALENEEYDVTLTLSGDSKNVTAAGFTVSVSLESAYYVLAEETSVRCTVTKAVVTVTAVGGVIKYGEKFTPTIIYEGFLGGDGKTNLISQAKIDNVPTESGYHSLLPSGAKSDNYDFVYVAGVLVINGTEAESDGIRIEGTLPPGFTITATGFAAESGAFKANAAAFDKALGASAIIPLSTEMKEYYAIAFGGNANADDYVYTIRFGAAGDNDKLYVKLASGEVKEVEFEAEEREDGAYLTFNAGEILGAALYTDKSIDKILIGYLPLIGIGLGLIAIIVVAIVIGVSSKKRRKRVQYRTVQARWK